MMLVLDGGGGGGIVLDVDVCDGWVAAFSR